MSDILDRKVKIDLIIDAMNALKSIESIADKLNQIKTANQSSTNSNFGQQLSQGAKEAGKAVDEAAEKFKSFQRQIAELKMEAQKAFQENGIVPKKLSDDLISVSKDFMEFRKTIKDVSASTERGFWENLSRGLPQTSSAFKEAQANIRALSKEIDEMQKRRKDPIVEKPIEVVSQKQIDEVTTIRNFIRDLENQKIRANIIGDVGSAREIQDKIDGYKQLTKVKAEVEKPVAPTANAFENYNRAIKEAEVEAQKFFRIWKETGDVNAKKQFEDMVPTIRELNKQSVEFYKNVGISANRGFYDLGHSLDYFMAKFRSHITWLGSGVMINSILNAPDMMIDNLKKIEQGMAGMVQTMPQLHGNQKALNDLTKDFLNLSSQYGEKIETTIEAAKLWSRAYKDQATVMALLHSSAVLSVADNFSMAEANKSLEATMSQLEWRATNSTEAMQYSMRIVDSWTWISHNAQVSARDLAEANERTAESAKLVGVDFDYMQGLIAAGVKNTGRSGEEIGNMLKSVFGSIHSDKAIKELESLGISVYKVGDNGTKQYRKVEDVLTDIMRLTQSTTVNTEELFKAISGGKFQWNKAAAMLSDYDETLRVMALSATSAGKANEQVGYQLDTITRKLATLNTESQKLLVEGTSEGFTTFLKEQITVITNVIRALQSLSSGTYQTVADIAKVSFGLMVASKAYDVIVAGVRAYREAQAASTVAEVANTAAKTSNIIITNANGVAVGEKTVKVAGETIAETVNTVETTANTLAKNSNTAASLRAAAASALATGGLTLVAGAIALATLGLSSYGQKINEVNDQIEKGVQKSDAYAASAEQIYAQEEKVGELLPKAIGQYESLLAKKQEVIAGSEEEIKLNKSLATTHDTLIMLISDLLQGTEQERKSKAESIVSSGNMREALAAEGISVDNLKDKVIQAAVAKIDAQITETRTLKEQAQDRVDALEKETKAVIENAKKQIQAYRAVADATKVNTSTSFWGFGQLNVNNDNPSLPPEVQQKVDQLETQKANLARITANLNGLEATRVDILSGGHKTQYPGSGANSDVPPSTKNQKGSSPSTSPSGNESQVARDELKSLTNTYSALANMIQNQYATALDVIKEKEDIYGQSVDTLNDKLKLNSEYWDKIQEQKTGITKQADDLASAIDGQSFQVVSGVSLADYKTMSKDQRGAVRENIRDTNQQNSLLLAQIEAYNKLLELIERYNKQQQKYHHENEVTRLKTLPSVQNAENQSAMALMYGVDPTEEQQHLMRVQQLQDKLSLPGSITQHNQDQLALNKENYDWDIKQYDIKIKLLELDKEHDIYKLGYKATDIQKNQIELAYAQKELVEAQNKLENARANGANSETLKQFQVEVDKAKNKFDELSNYIRDKIASGLEGITSEILIQGNSLRSVWNKLWSGLAEDALKALFRIQNNSPSLLGQVLGLFGGGGSSKAWNLSNGTKLDSSFGFGGGLFKTAHTGEYITGFPKMHDGGMVVPYLKNDEVVRTLQVGERVLSKSDNQLVEGLVAQNQALSTAMAQMGNNSGGETHIHIHTIDAQSFHEYLSNGGGEVLLNYLRQQNSLNNGM